MLKKNLTSKLNLKKINHIVRKQTKTNKNKQKLTKINKTKLYFLLQKNITTK